MLAFKKALNWQELFDIAFALRLQDQMSKWDLVATAYSVAGRFSFLFLWRRLPYPDRIVEGLSAKKRYQEAARVLLNYGKDVRDAVISLVQGNPFSEARRIVSWYFYVPAFELVFVYSNTDV